MWIKTHRCLVCKTPLNTSFTAFWTYIGSYDIFYIVINMYISFTILNEHLNLSLFIWYLRAPVVFVKSLKSIILSMEINIYFVVLKSSKLYFSTTELKVTVDTVKLV